MHLLRQDFLYGEQLEGWAAGGHLTLFTAFSREQARMLGQLLRCVHRTAECAPYIRMNRRRAKEYINLACTRLTPVWNRPVAC